MNPTMSPVARALRVRQLPRVAFWATVVTLAIAALFYLVTSLSWLDRPYPGFKVRLDGAVEVQLPPHSTGARAGLMPGDRIIAVDGKPLRDPRGLYEYVASKPIGRPIAYEIRRYLPNGGTVHMSKVIATQVHDRKQWASIFLALWLTGVSFLVLGTAVSVLKPGDPLARANMAFHFAGAAACLSIFDQSTNYLSPFHDPCKLLQWVIAVCFTNLALQFPRRYAGLEVARRLNLVAGLAMTGVLVACYAADRWTFWVMSAHLGYIAVGELILIANSLWTTFSPRSTPSEKGQGKALLLGTLLSTVPALIVPQAQSLGLHVDLEGLENFALPLWPLAISYAIVQHRLFDIRPLIKRSLTYLVSASVLTLLYGLSTMAVQALIGQRSHVPGIVATVVVVLLFAPLRDRVKAWLDTRFFRSSYQFDEVIGAFTKTAQESVEPQVLMRAYLDSLDRALAPTRMAIVLNEGSLHEGASLGWADAERLALVPLLASGPSTVSWQGETLQVLPLALQDHALGYAVVGPKKSDLAYTELDRALLEQLTQLLAMWLNLFDRFEKVRLQTQEIEALKRSEALQGQFLNMVSHELKVPLSVILSSLNILKRYEPTLEAKTVSHLDRIRRSLTHLMGLVGDLLNAGQLQSGHFQLRPQPLDLGTVAQETVAEMRPLAEQKAHALALEVSPDLPPVCGDRTRLEQVFRNLIHNAIRYTPSNGQIRLRLEIEGTDVRCEIQDTGPGIEATAIPVLFQRFRQVPGASTDRDQGVGLGLFIAKAIVEAHGGQIGVWSQPGLGSTFWFSVPVHLEHAEHEPCGTTPAQLG